MTRFQTLNCVAVAAACNLFRNREGNRKRGMIFHEPPTDRGGGGSTEPSTLAEALTQLGTARAEIGTVRTELATAQGERDQAKKDAKAATDNATQLQTDFNALKTTAGDQKAALDKAQGELKTAQADLTTARAEVTTKEARLSNLESLCGIRGIDPNQAVAASTTVPASTTSVKDWEAKLAAAKSPVERSQVTADYEAAVKAGKVSP